jgi:TnpA family transposase
MINDQAAGIGGKVVAGTVRDSLHMIDVLFNQDGGQRPDIVITDTGSYSDLVFGLITLLACSTGPRSPTSPIRRAGGSAVTPTTGC